MLYYPLPNITQFNPRITNEILIAILNIQDVRKLI